MSAAPFSHTECSACICHRCMHPALTSTVALRNGRVETGSGLSQLPGKGTAGCKCGSGGSGGLQ